MMVYKRIFKPLKKEVFLTILSVFAGLLSAALNLSRPILLGMIVGSLVGGKNNKIILLVSMYALSWILTWVLSIYLQYLCTKVSQKILKDLRVEVFAHFLALPFIEIEKVRQGKIEAYTMSDLPAWTNLYGTVLAEFVHSLAQFIGAIIALSYLDFSLTILVLPFLLLSMIIPWIMSNKLREISTKTQDSKSIAFEKLSGMIQGIQDLVSLGGKSWGLKKFRNSTESIYKSEIKQNLSLSLLRVSGSIAETGAYILVLAIGANLVLKHNLSVGELVAFLATIEMLFYPVRNAGNLFGSVQFSIGAASRVWKFLDKKIMNNAPIPTSSFEMRSVSFNYSNHDNSLKNISFTVEHGDFLVIVGESGSGKSTLLKLIAGLYQPTEGVIDYFNYQKNMAVVWQDPFLFNTTLIENLYFDKNANNSKQEWYAKLLNLESLIHNLPDEYESEVKNGGNNYSGGQKRRLALVRALLKDPNLLILDEPTSGLDNKNRQEVWNLIENMNENVTRIVSTHDLEIAKKADKVLVLSKGEIVEFGKPKQLLSKQGKISYIK